jgi:hypothetical protein
MNGDGKAIRPAYLMDIMRKLFPDISVEYPQLRPAQEQLETPAEGLYLLAEKLREYAAGEDNTLFFTLLSTYENLGEYNITAPDKIEALTFKIVFMRIIASFAN